MADKSSVFMHFLASNTLPIRKKKTKNASLVPLFIIPDKSIETKLAVYNIREECQAKIVDSNDSRVVYSG